MPLTLPDPQLPGDPQDALQSIQRNFEALARAIVDTTQIADGAVTGDKIAASTTSTASNSSGVTGTLTARKYADGLVLLGGGLARTNTGPLGTLSSGYRPSDTLYFVARGYGASPFFTPGYVGVSINTSGVVSVVIGGQFSTDIIATYLDGITFHAG